MNTGFLVSVDLSEGGPPRLGQQLVHLFSFLNMPLLFIIGGSISVLQEECPAARSEFVVNDVKSGQQPLFTSFTTNSGRCASSHAHSCSYLGQRFRPLSMMLP